MGKIFTVEYVTLDGTGASVVPQRPNQGRGNRPGARRLYATQRHAGVLGLDHDGDAFSGELAGEPVRDLLGQPLVDLGTVREVLDHARQLGQAKDPLTGQVPDMRDTDKRQQVVLAH
jgi:hypothetical protein